MDDFFSRAADSEASFKSFLINQSQRMSWIRLLMFILMVFAAAATYDLSPSGNALGAAAICVICFIAFIVAVRHHRAIRHRILRSDCHLAVLSRLMGQHRGAWSKLLYDGAEYLKDAPPQAKDLSLFGEHSLFQYICMARTKMGRDHLSNVIKDAIVPDDEVIAIAKKRQCAAAELAKSPEQLTRLLSALELVKDGTDSSEVLTAISNKSTRDSSALLRYGLPVITFITLLISVMGLLPWEVPALLLLLQLTISTAMTRRTAEVLSPLGEMHAELAPYKAVFLAIQEADFKDPYLRELQQRFTGDGVNAADALRTLSRITDAAYMRQNLVFLLLGNALFLWDLHCNAWLAAWKRRCGIKFGTWLTALAEFETLFSFASIAATRKTWCIPALLDSNAPEFNIREAHHPLLSENENVPNDTDAFAETRIITGSNMSGKTTYLRTLAISAVMAYAGALVPAKSFKLTRMAIFTSIRVEDDIAHGISTFYAELLRIKQMIDYSKSKQPMFIVIDEIFKGTNSADRITGAEEAIRHLTNPWSITMVSTHDFELCDLKASDGHPVDNFHFDEHYENDKILFDYKLKEGRCQTTNAKYLLHMAGIID